MPMTVVVTRDVAQRTRGFLASCMLEVAPGVYISPQMNPAVRVRICEVLAGWMGDWGAGIIVIWRDTKAPGGQGLLVYCLPTKDLQQHDGILLARRQVASKADKIAH